MASLDRVCNGQGQPYAVRNHSWTPQHLSKRAQGGPTRSIKGAKISTLPALRRSDLNILEFGAGGGVPAVLIHGFTGDGARLMDTGGRVSKFKRKLEGLDF
jgi:hypothetical protein